MCELHIYRITRRGTQKKGDPRWGSPENGTDEGQAGACRRSSEEDDAAHGQGTHLGFGDVVVLLLVVELAHQRDVLVQRVVHAQREGLAHILRAAEDGGGGAVLIGVLAVVDAQLGVAQLVGHLGQIALGVGAIARAVAATQELGADGRQAQALALEAVEHAFEAVHAGLHAQFVALGGEGLAAAAAAAAVRCCACICKVCATKLFEPIIKLFMLLIAG